MIEVLTVHGNEFVDKALLEVSLNTPCQAQKPTSYLKKGVVFVCHVLTLDQVRLGIDPAGLGPLLG